MMKFIDPLILTGLCLLVYWLSDQPTLPVPMLFEGQDKLHHMTMYAIMGITAWRAFRHFIAQPLALALVSVVFCSLYGVTDEYHQSFVPGRSSDIWDWVFDTLGASLTNLALFRLFRTKNSLGA